MIMPFQVTMVSSYLVLDATDLLDSPFAIIIPGVFSTFPIFIMTKFFKSIPEELIESAQLDGARRWTIFIRIGIPLGSGGIVSMVILSFLEYWNALEQPLTFLRDQTNWPLSLYLPQISSSNLGVSFIASLVMIMPAVCIFLRGQTYLEQGIVASGIKQ
jgi:multiple sugar transport system permease protein